MAEMFCQEFHVVGGQNHVCTKMYGHKGDHECLCRSWASVPSITPQQPRRESELEMDRFRKNIFAAMREKRR